MQTGRLFEIIYLLMERNQMTTTELARELEVSTRTIRRDVESLSAAGVPVYMTRGKGGGVHLLPHYVLDKSIVTETDQTEILAALSALRTAGAADRPETHTRLARAFQRENIDWIDIDFSFWGAPIEYRQAFDTIKEAIISRHLLRFEYFDAEGQASTRMVEPVRLDFKESNWYVRAFCLDRNDWRTFKLFRIRWDTMQVMDVSFEARELPYSLEKAPQPKATTDLKLLFDVEAEHRVREEFAPPSITIQEDGRLLVSLKVDLTPRMHYYLLSFGALLEVLEPASVRAWIRQQMKEVLEKYPKDF